MAEIPGKVKAFLAGRLKDNLKKPDYYGCNKHENGYFIDAMHNPEVLGIRIIRVPLFQGNIRQDFSENFHRVGN